jgi:hypothetical protein
MNRENAMNQINDEYAAEWIQDADAAEAEAGYGETQDWSEPESSSLTWDDEIVRETHREIAYRARKASSDRLY